MLIAERQFGLVHPNLVDHPSTDEVPSTISLHGRDYNKEKRRFLGVYIPPWRKMLNSYKRAPMKIKGKHLRP